MLSGNKIVKKRLNALLEKYKGKTVDEKMILLIVNTTLDTCATFLNDVLFFEVEEDIEDDDDGPPGLEF